MQNESSRDLTQIPPTPQKRTKAVMYVRNNHVTTVMLHGVSIVCLTIENKERLCLAQISNTLLKSYSYNEIHNRRVALGITCVQCTPVQLEILRRAGAMPISSRRCGMITKREAERLVKSFLEDNSPPKLPENFSFDVYHECGWGGRGKFEPSRYNSSRAKCIKCIYCNMYFSPNKFIFHFHKTPESKYNHPDAANFNSWRRHLKLVDFDADDVVHAWEDVKAMFNGGSRKRLLSTAIRGQSQSQTNHSQSSVKKPRANVSSGDNIESCQNSYPPFPFLSVPGKSYPISPFNHSPPFGIGLHLNKDNFDAKTSTGFQTGWGLPSFMPSYGMMWNHGLINPSRLPVSNNNCYSLKITNNDETRQTCEREHGSPSSSESSPSFCDKNERFSAFRPVGRNVTCRSTPDSTKTDDKVSCDEENDEINITDEILETESDEKAESLPIQRETKKGPISPGFISFGGQSSSEQDKEKKDLSDVSTTSEKGADKIPPKTEQNKTEADLPSEKKQDISEQALDLCCKSSLHQSAENVVQLSKEDLQDQLKKEMDLRRQIEKEIMDIKDALSHELLQERHVRLTLHQKLKEAHEALSKFSNSITSTKADSNY
ncbi:SKI family transcriptional corepressor 1,SKI family transcriptional corepressor 1 homolog-B,SKI family transcriptional corepressor 2 [Mytilus coruscus]|uniref:SKI family transcriptional corepressor 1,SKI family transcriptional corepressor 1 homolog-B,SKI family transcriptional corepressor 2 n=1 Tax=Mytilus coruscus TaxID=42192 RepID=A0A6J8DWI6_MYTCO|nr:SKI family transcriptional corepressor 1,SKI family transcriptional corepressor 1 homolog-B,SKI family transcriptional corepressor 2 [Mytilus coruscus]